MALPTMDFESLLPAVELPVIFLKEDGYPNVLFTILVLSGSLRFLMASEVPV